MLGWMMDAWPTVKERNDLMVSPTLVHALWINSNNCEVPTVHSLGAARGTALREAAGEPGWSASCLLTLWF